MHLNGSNGTSKNPALSGSSSVPHDEYEQEIDLIKLFNLLLLNKWIIIVFTLLFGISAAVYS